LRSLSSPLINWRTPAIPIFHPRVYLIQDLITSSSIENLIRLRGVPAALSLRQLSFISI